MSNTIKDIAKKVGVSTSTVSRALNDHKNISEKTKRKVRKAAEEMNFQKNSWASALRTKKTRIVGVIVPSLTNPFFARAISGVQNIANENGCRVVICQSNESLEMEIAQLNTLAASGAEGILLSVTAETVGSEHIESIEKQGIPVVFFDRALDNHHADKVEADDFGAGRMATKHLIDRGCKHIVHLEGPPSLRNSRNRKEGYLAALRENNLPIDESLIISTGYESDQFDEQIIEKIINASQKVDGIFAVSDPIAATALVKLKKRGIRVPEDIKIIGFGNDPIGELIEPNLSTITQMPLEMGVEAINLLMETMDGKGAKRKTVRQVYTEASLLPRESTIG